MSWDEKKIVTYVAGGGVVYEEVDEKFECDGYPYLRASVIDLLHHEEMIEGVKYS